ncbi:MAG TPA: DUF2442 domain-containing protein [Leptospiraceae bacterium]|nr:DUF2442 domain-containing protein [Leptospiraceae bacterium]HMW03695.1 DUF2442 domain-containing protein [Leptospiraceae bacterium]HMX34612.1 DUF2442 domain-containing protein [Leptospiraceae bacterium]HMY31749.1 DUF2442 domain-containing protein [Leptospiraceae bacterium]HMZ64542.1 DUF2442 domain-containing protein [Leptospiraceae bacterium]
MANDNNPTELKPPRINKIFIDKQNIYVLFVDNTIKKYDIGPLLEKKSFTKLKNLSYLKTAKVDSGGYGISWDDECDLSENELWTKGVIVKDREELAKLHLLFVGMEKIF